MSKNISKLELLPTAWLRDNTRQLKKAFVFRVKGNRWLKIGRLVACAVDAYSFPVDFLQEIISFHQKLFCHRTCRSGDFLSKCIAFPRFRRRVSWRYGKLFACLHVFEWGWNHVYTAGVQHTLDLFRQRSKRKILFGPPLTCGPNVF